MLPVYVGRQIPGPNCPIWQVTLRLEGRRCDVLADWLAQIGECRPPPFNVSTLTHTRSYPTSSCKETSPFPPNAIRLCYRSMICSTEPHGPSQHTVYQQ